MDAAEARALSLRRLRPEVLPAALRSAWAPLLQGAASEPPPQAHRAASTLARESLRVSDDGSLAVAGALVSRAARQGLLSTAEALDAVAAELAVAGGPRARALAPAAVELALLEEQSASRVEGDLGGERAAGDRRLGDGGAPSPPPPTAAGAPTDAPSRETWSTCPLSRAVASGGPGAAAVALAAAGALAERLERRDEGENSGPVPRCLLRAVSRALCGETALRAAVHASLSRRARLAAAAGAGRGSESGARARCPAGASLALLLALWAPLLPAGPAEDDAAATLVGVADATEALVALRCAAASGAAGDEAGPAFAADPSVSSASSSAALLAANLWRLATRLAEADRDPAPALRALLALPGGPAALAAAVEGAPEALADPLVAWPGGPAGAALFRALRKVVAESRGAAREGDGSGPGDVEERASASAPASTPFPASISVSASPSRSPLALLPGAVLRAARGDASSGEAARLVSDLERLGEALPEARAAEAGGGVFPPAPTLWRSPAAAAEALLAASDEFDEAFAAYDAHLDAQASRGAVEAAASAASDVPPTFPLPLPETALLALHPSRRAAAAALHALALQRDQSAVLVPLAVHAAHAHAAIATGKGGASKADDRGSVSGEAREIGSQGVSSGAVDASATRTFSAALRARRSAQACARTVAALPSLAPSDPEGASVALRAIAPLLGPSAPPRARALGLRALCGVWLSPGGQRAPLVGALGADLHAEALRGGGSPATALARALAAERVARRAPHAVKDLVPVLEASVASADPHAAAAGLRSLAALVDAGALSFSGSWRVARDRAAARELERAFADGVLGPAWVRFLAAGAREAADGVEAEEARARLAGRGDSGAEADAPLPRVEPGAVADAPPALDGASALVPAPASCPVAPPSTPEDSAPSPHAALLRACAAALASIAADPASCPAAADAAAGRLAGLWGSAGLRGGWVFAALRDRLGAWGGGEGSARFGGVSGSGANARSCGASAGAGSRPAPASAPGTFPYPGFKRLLRVVIEDEVHALPRALVVGRRGRGATGAPGARAQGPLAEAGADLRRAALAGAGIAARGEPGDGDELSSVDVLQCPESAALAFRARAPRGPADSAAAARALALSDRLLALSRASPSPAPGTLETAPAALERAAFAAAAWEAAFGRVRAAARRAGRSDALDDVWRGAAEALLKGREPLADLAPGGGAGREVGSPRHAGAASAAEATLTLSAAPPAPAPLTRQTLGPSGRARAAFQLAGLASLEPSARLAADVVAVLATCLGEPASSAAADRRDAVSSSAATDRRDAITSGVRAAAALALGAALGAGAAADETLAGAAEGAAAPKGAPARPAPVAALCAAADDAATEASVRRAALLGLGLAAGGLSARRGGRHAAGHAKGPRDAPSALSRAQAAAALEAVRRGVAALHRGAAAVPVLEAAEALWGAAAPASSSPPDLDAELASAAAAALGAVAWAARAELSASPGSARAAAAAALLDGLVALATGGPPSHGAPKRAGAAAGAEAAPDELEGAVEGLRLAALGARRGSGAVRDILAASGLVDASGVSKAGESKAAHTAACEPSAAAALAPLSLLAAGRAAALEPVRSDAGALVARACVKVLQAGLDEEKVTKPGKAGRRGPRKNGGEDAESEHALGSGVDSSANDASGSGADSSADVTPSSASSPIIRIRGRSVVLVSTQSDARRRAPRSTQQQQTPFARAAALATLGRLAPLVGRFVAEASPAAATATSPTALDGKVLRRSGKGSAKAKESGGTVGDGAASSSPSAPAWYLSALAVARKAAGKEPTALHPSLVWGLAGLAEALRAAARRGAAVEGGDEAGAAEGRRGGTLEALPAGSELRLCWEALLGGGKESAETEEDEVEEAGAGEKERPETAAASGGASPAHPPSSSRSALASLSLALQSLAGSPRLPASLEVRLGAHGADAALELARRGALAPAVTAALLAAASAPGRGRVEPLARVALDAAADLARRGDDAASARLARRFAGAFPLLLEALGSEVPEASLRALAAAGALSLSACGSANDGARRAASADKAVKSGKGKRRARGAVEGAPTEGGGAKDGNSAGGAGDAGDDDGLGSYELTREARCHLVVRQGVVEFLARALVQRDGQKRREDGEPAGPDVDACRSSASSRASSRFLWPRALALAREADAELLSAAFARASAALGPDGPSLRSRAALARELARARRGSAEADAVVAPLVARALRRGGEAPGPDARLARAEAAAVLGATTWLLPAAPAARKQARAGRAAGHAGGARAHREAWSALAGAAGIAAQHARGAARAADLEGDALASREPSLASVSAGSALASREASLSAGSALASREASLSAGSALASREASLSAGPALASREASLSLTAAIDQAPPEVRASTALATLCFAAAALRPDVATLCEAEEEEEMRSEASSAPLSSTPLCPSSPPLPLALRRLLSSLPLSLLHALAPASSPSLDGAAREDAPPYLPPPALAAKSLEGLRDAAVAAGVPEIAAAALGACRESLAEDLLFWLANKDLATV